MGIHNRPANCGACNKRLSLKTWYYRNGKWFCNRRCWDSDQAKQAAEAEKAQEKPEAPAQEEKEEEKKDKKGVKEQKPQAASEAGKDTGKQQQGAKA